MQIALLVFVISALTTYLATPLVIRFAHRFNLVDDPKKHVHPAIIHKKTIPRAGGVAIWAGIIISIFLFIPITKPIIGLVSALTLAMVVGVLDDRYDLSPYLRLASNLVVALLVVGSGIGIGFIGSPFGGVLRLDQIVWNFNILGGSHSIIVLADLFAIIWIVWVANMLNWSKGVDGQMPGIAAIAAAVLGIASLRFLPTDPTQITSVQLSAAAVGAAVGFIPFNWHPAKIFPGYSGSTVLGITIATLAILSGAKVATAVLVMAIPMIDGAFVIFRRLASKKSPFFGDRGHLHHRLLGLGWSHQKIALFYWILCAILGLAALTLHSFEKFLGAIIILFWVLAVIVTFSLVPILNKKKS